MKCRLYRLSRLLDSAVDYRTTEVDYRIDYRPVVLNTGSASVETGTARVFTTLQLVLWRRTYFSSRRIVTQIMFLVNHLLNMQLHIIVNMTWFMIQRHSCNFHKICGENIVSPVYALGCFAILVITAATPQDSRPKIRWPKMAMKRFLEDWTLPKLWRTFAFPGTSCLWFYQIVPLIITVHRLIGTHLIVEPGSYRHDIHELLVAGIVLYIYPLISHHALENSLQIASSRVCSRPES